VAIVFKKEEYRVLHEKFASSTITVDNVQLIAFLRIF